jgi:hypothetical protein
MSMAGKDVANYPEDFAVFRGSDFKGEFSFEVVPGSTMPKSQFARREQTIQLGQSGFLDQRAVLEAFDWPNIEEVINRMLQGPLGQLIERLEGTGQFDPLTLEVIQKIGSMSENDYKQLFQKKPPQYGGTQLTPAQAGKG